MYSSPDSKRYHEDSKMEESLAFSSIEKSPDQNTSTDQTQLQIDFKQIELISNENLRTEEIVNNENENTSSKKQINNRSSTMIQPISKDTVIFFL